MYNFLSQVLAKKRQDLEEQMKQSPVGQAPDETAARENKHAFREALLHPKGSDIALIAEIKLASPTEKDLGKEEDIVPRAKLYEQAGADAISYITEPHFFQGKSEHIPILKKEVSIPILQKDFVIDEYQITQAFSLGSDAILLIARILEEDQLREFVRFSLSLGIEPVVEVHSEEDLEKAIATSSAVIAVNARDLDTFETNIQKACKLLQQIPDDRIKLGFSGIHSRLNVKEYKQAGAHAVLVGTSLMKAEDVIQFINQLKLL